MAKGKQENNRNNTINTLMNNLGITNSAVDVFVKNSIPSVGANSSVSDAQKITLSTINKPKAEHNRHIKTPVIRQNSNNYPYTDQTKNADTGDYIYDYTIKIQNEIIEAIKKEKENLNIPSAYSRRELNNLFHTKFNRFRIQYPDYFMNNTIAYVVMTRPDLNLFGTDYTINDQILNDPQMYYIMNADIETAKTLTKDYSTEHHFNPLLSNTLTSIDISDESIDTLETGETFTGFKTQYAKSNIRSMTAGTINLKFPETYNMAVTHAHQIWCTYESSVYRGNMKPKDKYIWGKELDYACDIYYFLLDVEDMIIRYWTKYTGCFPLNVNKSVFSYDAGSQLNHPELSVTYAYFARDDMNAITLNEFNNNSGGDQSNFKYKANYDWALGVSGNTWANAPFVVPIEQGNGMGRNATLYALRFKS